MAVTSPVVCARSLCREALTRTHMHVNHRTGMTHPSRKAGQPLLHACPGNLHATAKTLPVLPTHNCRARLALEILIKIECGAAKM